ncbi:MAG: SLC13 family permease [Deltaproteobacteria bacterium]|jgi:di/tricarboxylate transporter|nr:SLC13 family permease [Deltaproteobacteria bacterium]MBW2504878.1 SLC13 family permease [Deltaproteobacteria bacterium]
MEITLTLLILATAIVLFATDWIRMDLVSLMVLLSLAVTGLVTVEEAFSGFSNPAVITVAAMFVLGAGISYSGSISKVGEHLVNLTGHNHALLTAAIMGTVAFFSAFINNIGATAVLMPVVIMIAKKVKTPPSKFLIPLAFGSLLGGVCTLIGTPPNILMNILLQEYAGEQFSMFDFTPVGLVLLACGIAYMALIGRHILPERKSGTLTEAYQVKEYITEVEILKGSPLENQTIAKSAIERELNMKVRAILRDKQKIPRPQRNRKLRVGDILFLEGDPQGVMKVKGSKGLAMVPERDNPQPSTADSNIVVVEASLSPTSEMVGKTLRQVQFADTHGLTVLAIWRSGSPVVRKVDHVILRFGDVLLLQGPEEKVRHLGEAHGFLLLGGVDPVKYRPDKAPIAIVTMVGVILLSVTGSMPIMLSATIGATVMVLTRCLTLKEAYENIDWPIILLIAGTLPLGHAMENSGAAEMLAHLVVGGVGHLGPWVVLGAIFLMTFCLTEVMSHAAAAVLVAPIAYNTAIDLAVSPKPFFMAVAIAASMCFMTPISHQSNALVMGPGGYKFFDYTLVGTPLNITVWIVSTLMIPLIFPF